MKLWHRFIRHGVLRTRPRTCIDCICLWYPAVIVFGAPPSHASSFLVIGAQPRRRFTLGRQRLYPSTAGITLRRWHRGCITLLQDGIQPLPLPMRTSPILVLDSLLTAVVVRVDNRPRLKRILIAYDQSSRRSPLAIYFTCRFAPPFS